MNLEIYPNKWTEADGKISPQSVLFGHRIKPAQSRMEYLVEFLALAMAKKKIKNTDDPYVSDMFIIDDRCNEKAIEYLPKSNMGLKRFIFFYNSKIETKSSVDEEAAEECVKMVKQNVSCDIDDLNLNECVSIIQTILYDFSIENSGRSWFNKNLLPVSPEVLFPEALGRKSLRNNVSLDSEDLDSKFDFNSYTYQCRGGEIFYLHLLQALNDDSVNSNDCRGKIEKGINDMLNSMSQVTNLCDFIQKKWVDYSGIQESTDDVPDVKKTAGFIPKTFNERNKCVLSELVNFFGCDINPMERIDILSYGMLLQLLRAMFTTASKRIGSNDEAWVLDLCTSNTSEKAEIRKLTSDCYRKNEETIKNYINSGINELCGTDTEEKKYDKFKKASTDSYKLFRKLAKDIGIMIPLKGDDMRFTLSENIIKFLVMALIPASSKVTYDTFLDKLYYHFNMIVTPEHYAKALVDGKVSVNSNVSYLYANKFAFSQKLKDCGFLRDLSDATAIVENPYEGV